MKEEEINELEMVKSFARAWNTLNSQILESLLAENIVYTSQELQKPLAGKERVLGFIHRKMELIRNSEEKEFKVYAEVGYCGSQKGYLFHLLSAYDGRPVAVIAQGNKEIPIGLTFLEVKENLIERIDICSILPHPSTAKRTGEYPT